MSILDELSFEPDSEIRQLLIEFESGEHVTNEPIQQRSVDVQSLRYRTKLTNLFQMRRVKRLTQAELASKAGTSRRSIIAIENGQSEPSVFLALAIAEVLDTPVEELFYLKPLPHHSDKASIKSWVMFSKSKRRTGRI